jgi:hypothetical protein
LFISRRKEEKEERARARVSLGRSVGGRCFGRFFLSDPIQYEMGKKGQNLCVRQKKKKKNTSQGRLIRRRRRATTTTTPPTLLRQQQPPQPAAATRATPSPPRPRPS